MMPRPELVADFGCSFQSIFEKLNTKIKILLDRDHQIGHSYFINTKYANADISILKEIWFSEIIPLLNEYFYCDWEKLSAQAWLQVLYWCPQMWVRCDWDKMQQLDGESWRILLIKIPQFAYYCNWESLSGDDWNELLIYWPRFFDRCNHKKLTGKDWTNILCNNPRFANYCDWEKLDKNDWEKLLSQQPQFHNIPHRKF